jgi:hypothetical protein
VLLLLPVLLPLPGLVRDLVFPRHSVAPAFFLFDRGCSRARWSGCARPTAKFRCPYGASCGSLLEPVRHFRSSGRSSSWCRGGSVRHSGCVPSFRCATRNGRRRVGAASRPPISTSRADARTSPSVANHRAVELGIERSEPEQSVDRRAAQTSCGGRWDSRRCGRCPLSQRI